MTSSQNSVTRHHRAHTIIEDSKASTIQFRKLETMKRRTETPEVADSSQYKTKFEKIKLLPTSQERLQDQQVAEQVPSKDLIISLSKSNHQMIPKSGNAQPEAVEPIK
mmetsp:Transcript_7772/g.8794  ORF Transcript_7772/g.8794 Transcript_7772/m.8794 type:complete len:108 (-) Transcript_7772:26-349(-)